MISVKHRMEQAPKEMTLNEKSSYEHVTVRRKYCHLIML
jgi:hypothetical protein